MTDASSIAAHAPRRLERPDGQAIAYHTTPGKSPGVVYVGGLMSDMTGTKATALDAYCRAEGRAYTRFDYLGHGASSGEFTQGTIGRWADDAIAVIDAATEGPQVLVGSSMGGWIMLLAAMARAERVCGLVGIAAAPDFTEDLFWNAFDDETRATLMRDGIVYRPSDYEEGPYPITRALIEEGRAHLVLRSAIPLTCPVRLLHGIEDADVPWRTALTLAETLDSDDIDVILVKRGTHTLSEPADLARLWRAVSEVCALGG
ncbi:MAG: alpha/beta hydrolase [Alphaproteobacteria bacterium]